MSAPCSNPPPSLCLMALAHSLSNTHWLSSSRICVTCAVLRSVAFPATSRDPFLVESIPRQSAWRSHPSWVHSQASSVTRPIVILHSLLSVISPLAHEAPGRGPAVTATKRSCSRRASRTYNWFLSQSNVNGGDWTSLVQLPEHAAPMARNCIRSVTVRTSPRV